MTRFLSGRRRLLAAAAALGAPTARAAGDGAREGPPFAEVRAGTALAFPRDHGSHPLFRTEWWYVTGWLADARGAELGVQVTFFRSRPRVAEDGASRFAPRQLLFAHAAIADASLGRLRHDQRAAREGFGLAHASTATTDVAIDGWSLALERDAYFARVSAREFSLALRFEPRAPPLLQGELGVSRKGPLAAQASFYYSRPRLATSGAVTIDGRAREVTGTCWLDHEWSSEYLAPQAQGWDWIGINLDDGGALMAFVIRAKAGGALWAGGKLRDAAGVERALAPGDVRFAPLRTWRSPRTGVEYPVAMRVIAGDLDVELEPLMPDQELDSRRSVGTVYWEGAVRASSRGRGIGRGYLELTGYGGAAPRI